MKWNLIFAAVILGVGVLFNWARWEVGVCVLIALIDPVERWNELLVALKSRKEDLI